MVTDGSDFKGERLTVQFARGPRRKENSDRPSVPRPRRTIYRMQISGLPETSWQVSSPCPFIPGSLGFALFGPYENPSFKYPLAEEIKIGNLPFLLPSGDCLDCLIPLSGGPYFPEGPLPMGIHLDIL